MEPHQQAEKNVQDMVIAVASNVSYVKGLQSNTEGELEQSARDRPLAYPSPPPIFFCDLAVHKRPNAETTDACHVTVRAPMVCKPNPVVGLKRCKVCTPL